MKVVIMMINNIKEVFKSFLLFNIVTFLFLIWKLHPSNDVNISGKYLERKYNQNGHLNINFNRLLEETKVEQEDLNVKNSVNRKNKKMKKKKKKGRTCKKPKIQKKYDLDNYMQRYKDRYSNRIGFGKFDCYCENKMFRGFNKLNRDTDKPNMTKRKFLMEIFKKYGVRICLTYISYLFSLIVGVVQYIYKNKYGIFALLKSNILKGWDFLNDNVVLSLDYFLLYGLPIILTLIIIYVIIKIVKYKRLKSHKSKMDAVECCHLCNDVS